MATTKKNTDKKATVTTLSTVNVIVIQGGVPLPNGILSRYPGG